MMIKILKMISPINFHWPNLPHFGVNLDIDPINLFISDNHVPMEIGTDVSKIVRKKKVFKMCFRSQIMQKRTRQINFFFQFSMEKISLGQIWTWGKSGANLDMDPINLFISMYVCRVDTIFTTIIVSEVWTPFLSPQSITLWCGYAYLVLGISTTVRLTRLFIYFILLASPDGAGWLSLSAIFSIHLSAGWQVPRSVPFYGVCHT